jgi:hypothetical protein
LHDTTLFFVELAESAELVQHALELFDGQNLKRLQAPAASPLIERRVLYCQPENFLYSSRYVPKDRLVMVSAEVTVGIFAENLPHAHFRESWESLFQLLPRIAPPELFDSLIY